jgi:hypothetical protein
MFSVMPAGWYGLSMRKDRVPYLVVFGFGLAGLLAVGLAVEPPAPSGSMLARIVTLEAEIKQLRLELDQMRTALVDAGQLTVDQPHDFSPILTPNEKKIGGSGTTTRPSKIFK